MRLPAIDPDHLDEDQHELYAALTSRPEVRSMGLVGPFGVWMHAPSMGAAMARLGREIRFEASLPPDVTEVAICTTGAFFRAAFEFAAHRRMAIAAGVDEDRLDRLAAGEDPGFEGDAHAAYTIATELLRDHAITEPAHADGEQRFGPRGMVELVTTVGYYSLISLLLNGFDVDLPTGMANPFDAGYDGAG